ncbi:MAG: hypothetical protein R3C97_04465 [Geminicoccaceae bacterium]
MTVFLVDTNIAWAAFCDETRLTPDVEGGYPASGRRAVTYALGPRRIGLTVETGSFRRRARQLDYIADPSDWIARNGAIYRQGMKFGQLAGREAQRYLAFACAGDDPLSAFFVEGEGDDPKIYRIRSRADDKEGTHARVRQVWRKTRIVDTARLDRFEFAFILEHRIVLELDPIYPGRALSMSRSRHPKVRCWPPTRDREQPFM